VWVPAGTFLMGTADTSGVTIHLVGLVNPQLVG
jgi:hypothetical protein